MLFNQLLSAGDDVGVVAVDVCGDEGAFPLNSDACAMAKGDDGQFLFVLIFFSSYFLTSI